MSIEEKELELKLVSKLPDNGVRESALLDLKRKWEREDESCLVAALLIMIFCGFLVFAGYMTGVWNNNRQVIERVEKVKNNYHYDTSFSTVMGYLDYIETGKEI